jgi:hypothetical protein
MPASRPFGFSFLGGTGTSACCTTLHHRGAESKVGLSRPETRSFRPKTAEGLPPLRDVWNDRAETAADPYDSATPKLPFGFHVAISSIRAVPFSQRRPEPDACADGDTHQVS